MKKISGTPHHITFTKMNLRIIFRNSLDGVPCESINFRRGNRLKFKECSLFERHFSKSVTWTDRSSLFWSFTPFSDVINHKQKTKISKNLVNKRKKKHINKTKKLGVLNTANSFKHRLIDCLRYYLSTTWNNWHIFKKYPRQQVLVLQWIDCSVIVLHNRPVVIIRYWLVFISWVLLFRCLEFIASEWKYCL